MPFLRNIPEFGARSRGLFRNFEHAIDGGCRVDLFDGEEFHRQLAVGRIDMDHLAIADDTPLTPLEYQALLTEPLGFLGLTLTSSKKR